MNFSVKNLEFKKKIFIFTYYLTKTTIMSTFAIVVILLAVAGGITYLVTKGKVKDENNNFIPDAIETKVEEVKEVVKEVKAKVKKTKAEVTTPKATTKATTTKKPTTKKSTK